MDKLCETRQNQRYSPNKKKQLTNREKKQIKGCEYFRKAL